MATSTKNDAASPGGEHPRQRFLGKVLHGGHICRLGPSQGSCFPCCLLTRTGFKAVSGSAVVAGGPVWREVAWVSLSSCGALRKGRSKEGHFHPLARAHRAVHALHLSGQTSQDYGDSPDPRCQLQSWVRGTQARLVEEGEAPPCRETNLQRIPSWGLLSLPLPKPLLLIRAGQTLAGRRGLTC